MRFNVDDQFVAYIYEFNNGKISTPSTIEDNMFFTEYQSQLYLNDIRLLYNRHIFKIKQITNNTIIAEKIGPNNVLKEYEFKKRDYNLLYPIEKVEAYIKNMYEPYIYSFQQILHKSREIKALGDDIINIARSNGINNIADSNLCDAVSDIRSLVEEIGWNTSSLSC